MVEGSGTIRRTPVRSDQSGTITADGTEQILFEKAESSPWILDSGNVDLSNLQSGDQIYVRMYKKIADGGNYLLIGPDTLNKYSDGLRDGWNIIEYSKISNVYGIKVTLEQIEGTYRDFDHEWWVIE